MPALEGWRTAPVPVASGLRWSILMAPERTDLAGAKAFAVSLSEPDAMKAAHAVASVLGFQSARQIARSEVPSDVIERMEKGGRVTALMLEGTVDGAPVSFIAHVWYGAIGEPDGKAYSGVHGFLAPETAFVALGGHAIPAIQFLRAAATEEAPVSEDGALPPQEQSGALANMFASCANAAVTAAGGDMAALASILNSNRWVTPATGCIDMHGCLGGGTAPVYTPPRY